MSGPWKCKSFFVHREFRLFPTWWDTFWGERPTGWCFEWLCFFWSFEEWTETDSNLSCRRQARINKLWEKGQRGGFSIESSVERLEQQFTIAEPEPWERRR